MCLFLSFFVYASDGFTNSDKVVPRISKTTPMRNHFTNGSDFSVKYSEDDLKEIKLNIDHQNITKTDCLPGRNQICNFEIDLSAHDNQELIYYFTAEDQSGNIGFSKTTQVFVDTTTPIIENISYFVTNKRIDIIITFIEENLYKIEYLDNQNSRPKWTNFCTHGIGRCEKKFTFKGGDGPDLTIRITDKAGNRFERHI